MLALAKEGVLRAGQNEWKSFGEIRSRRGTDERFVEVR